MKIEYCCPGMAEDVNWKEVRIYKDCIYGWDKEDNYISLITCPHCGAKIEITVREAKE